MWTIKHGIMRKFYLFQRLINLKRRLSRDVLGNKHVKKYYERLQEN